MNRSFVVNFAAELDILCNQLDFFQNHPNDFFFKYLQKMNLEISNVDTEIFKNLIFNAIILLKYFPNEYGDTARLQANQAERIEKIEALLSQLCPLLDKTVDYYIKETAQLNDNYFSMLAIILKMQNAKIHPDNYLKNLTKNKKTLKHRAPNPINYKISFYLFKLAFTLVCKKLPQPIYVEPHKYVASLLSEDSNRSKRKIDPVFLTVCFLDHIGFGLNEKTIRTHINRKSEELSIELKEIGNNKYSNLDELIKAFKYSRPDLLFEPDEVFNYSILDLKKANLILRSKAKDLYGI